MQRSVYESNEASSRSFLRGQNLRLGLLQPRLRRWKKKEATDVVKVGTNRERDEVLEKEEEEEEEEMNAKNNDDKNSSSSEIMKPMVLYEDDDVLAVYKPAKISFHSEFEDGLVKILRKMKEEDDSFYCASKIYTVHRIDKPTSGIVLFAKSKAVAKALSLAFEKREIVKYYVGVSERKPRKKMGKVSGAMKRARRGMWMLTREQSLNQSMTSFVSFGFSSHENVSLRYFVFKPETGKTHQLRVHAKSLGSALLGDKMYGGSGKNDNDNDNNDSSKVAISDRMYLHAAVIRVPKLRIFEEDDNGETSSSSTYETKAFQVISEPIEGKYWDNVVFRKFFSQEKEGNFGEWTFEEQNTSGLLNSRL